MKSQPLARNFHECEVSREMWPSRAQTHTGVYADATPNKNRYKERSSKLDEVIVSDP